MVSSNMFITYIIINAIFLISLYVYSIKDIRRDIDMMKAIINLDERIKNLESSTK